jgi:general secretion pathway protein L
MKLGTEIKIDPAEFFKWWKSELAFLVPERFRAIGSGVKDELLFRVRDFTVYLSIRTVHGEEELGSFNLDKEGGNQIAQLFEENPKIKDAQKVLLLTPKQAVIKTVTMPVTTEENLRQAIVFEMDRFTPFNIEDIYYDIEIVGINKEGSLLKVNLVCAPKWKLDALYKEIVSLGIFLNAARAQGSEQDSGRVELKYNLLPESYRRKENKGPIIANIALLFILVLLIGGSLYYPLWFKSQVVSELTEQVAAAAKKAKEVEKITDESDTLINDAKTVIKIKETEPSMVNALNELTQRLKDDTWLKRFQYSDHRVQIQGISPSASTLIGIIEASPFFSNTRFVSPVTQDRKTGFERFQIATDMIAGETDAGKP